MSDADVRREVAAWRMALVSAVAVAAATLVAVGLSVGLSLPSWLTVVVWGALVISGLRAGAAVLRRARPTGDQRHTS